jgi:hypothetical protein
LPMVTQVTLAEPTLIPNPRSYRAGSQELLGHSPQQKESCCARDAAWQLLSLLQSRIVTRKHPNHKAWGDILSLQDLTLPRNTPGKSSLSLHSSVQEAKAGLQGLLKLRG